MVFYDENANGIADPTEVVRLPNVTVTIGDRAGTSMAAGQFTVQNVPMGTQNITLAASGLPAYFSQGASVSVAVPQAAGSILAVPAVLAIGSNKPNVYLAYGDSITAGTGSSDGSGYRSYFQADMRALWGAANVPAVGLSGKRSNAGIVPLGAALATHRPAYTLILFGTNDWNDVVCREAPPCYTIDSLRAMIQDARGSGSSPIIGTIPPVNPKWVDKGATERNEWVKAMNAEIRKMAAAEKAPVADIHALFTAKSDMTTLFDDTVHPNDQGYQLIGQAFVAAVTRPRGSAGLRHSPFSTGF
jgi:lysophospholipase L1-like esterase